MGDFKAGWEVVVSVVYTNCFNLREGGEVSCYSGLKFFPNGFGTIVDHLIYWFYVRSEV